MNETQSKKMYKKKQPKQNERTPTKKNVSWANTEYSDYDKKTLPSTPYPKATRKLKISANSSPKCLSFTVCNSDEDTFITLPETNKKRKRFEKKSNWIVTSCSNLKPDKTNKPIEEKSKHVMKKFKPDFKFKTKQIEDKLKQGRIVNTRNGSYVFEEETFPSKQILKNIMKDELEELLSDSDSQSPDELIPIEMTYSPNITFESSSDESSDSNSNLIFNPPEIKLDEKACQIIEFKIESPKPPTDIDDTIKLKLKKNEKPKKNERTKTPNISILEKVEYFLGETYTIIKLKHPYKLYFNGKLSMIVLSGKLEVLGHVLEFNNETEFEIYNPRGQSFLCLETLESKKNPNVLNLLKQYLDEGNITKIKTLKDNDCIIAVRNLQNNMTEYLEKHVAQHLYPNTLQFNKRPLMKLENKLSCLFEAETASLKLYKKPENWEKIVKSSLLKIKECDSRTILCGGKNVGKSTLLRYMINNMLNQVDEVVCVDLDPGQSEFTISGCVSVSVINSPIFGPNYTHLRNPKKSFFIGDVNLTTVLDRYIKSVQELLNYCDANISKKIPWIINCMGFSKSIGTDIIVLIIKLLKPSIVVQLESSKQSKNYSSHLTCEFVKNFVPSFPLEIPNNELTYSLEIINSVAEEIVSGEWITEPYILRDMCILSYFSQMLEDKNEITAAIPYGVKLPLIRLHNVNYSMEHTLATINGNLVALCESNETVIETNTPISCYGFGIVRGIDKQSDELYLLTPIDENLLENVNLLVRGNLALPPSIFMTTGHQGLVPYIQLGTLQGTSAIPKRSFISWKVLLNKK